MRFTYLDQGIHSNEANKSKKKTKKINKNGNEEGEKISKTITQYLERDTTQNTGTLATKSIQ